MSDLPTLLEKTSRTFALAIPLLPEPARTDVGIAYLVFRIADTLEDAGNMRPQLRIYALREFIALLQDFDLQRAAAFAQRWCASSSIKELWYRVLLNDTPLVLEELSKRRPEIQRIIRVHARETVWGMISFLRKGETCLQSLAQLKRYCFFVAGVVGEMLTEIFAERIDGLDTSPQVMQLARSYGEGLQLVNILKDSEEDGRCGRLFIPKAVERSTLVDLAGEDLRQAGLYVDALRASNAAAGYVAFAQLPLKLALATLDCLESSGPGAKVPRHVVARILANTTSGVHSVHGKTQQLHQLEEA